MRDIAHQWSRWRGLSRTDKRSLFALALLLPFVDIALRTAGLKRTQAWLLRLGGNRKVLTPPYADIEATDAQRLAELAAIAGARGIYPITCLRQALLVQCWLRRRGLAAQLRLGALKNVDGTLNAHAWVELNGVALAQPALCHEAFPGLEDIVP